MTTVPKYETLCRFIRDVGFDQVVSGSFDGAEGLIFESPKS